MKVCNQCGTKTSSIRAGYHEGICCDKCQSITVSYNQKDLERQTVFKSYFSVGDRKPEPESTELVMAWYERFGRIFFFKG